MTTRARLQNANDSKSLWNYTLSPGWSEFDAHILRLAVMRYGCGAWRDINKHFPFKTCGQLNLQTQRLFGQQALAEFNKVHIDPLRIKEINDKIDGFRKNTCLINEGNNLRAEEKEARRKKHIEKFGIPKEIYEQITVPVVLDPPLPCKTVVDDIEKLREMYRAVYDIQLRRQHLAENNGKNSANIAVKAKQERNQKKNNKNNKNKKEQKSNDKNKNEQEKEKEEEKMEVEEETNKDNDVEIIDKPKEPEPAQAVAADINMMDMDEETAMAMALSASMAQTNINTPAVEKKAKSKHTSKRKKTKKSAKKSTKKSAKKSAKKSRKRKKMDADGDEEYIPGGAEPKKEKI